MEVLLHIADNNRRINFHGFLENLNAFLEMSFLDQFGQRQLIYIVTCCAESLFVDLSFFLGHRPVIWCIYSLISQELKHFLLLFAKLFWRLGRLFILGYIFGSPQQSEVFRIRYVKLTFLLILFLVVWIVVALVIFIRFFFADHFLVFFLMFHVGLIFC